ncbi:telomere-associated protein RIF1-like [Salarias fasciatus]|nr:telomere-associated protein RIF1-like [Salarias fasciatus]
MLLSWSRLYRVFDRCSALVVTAEENICCEELSAKMAAALDPEALSAPPTASALAGMLQVMVECVDFSPFTPQFQQKLQSPHTPVGRTQKKSRALGNLSGFLSLLVRCLVAWLDAPASSCEAAAPALLAVVSALFGGLALPDAVREALAGLVPTLARLFGEEGGEPHVKVDKQLEKLLADVLGGLQTRSALAFDSELLALLSPLLCAAFPHRNKQVRLAATHFWNATFANTASLSYPEEIRPVLLQVRQRTPIILPGFQASDVPGELGGLEASESSQLETKISGIPVSVGLKDCRVSLPAGSKDKTPTTPKTPKPASTKLDFGSPKPPRRDVLEEEASIDFVFIPPEAKERVLTEHQKEVMRTKRVDIPAMYNNLDASLDTTAFSQYTQSQDDSQDKLPAQPAAAGDSAAQVPQKEVAIQEVSEVVAEDGERAEPRPDSAGIPAAEEGECDETAPADGGSKESPGLNASSSSDVVSGTPQKLNSRRQSFITLEKYAEGKSGSPSVVSSFTGPLAKASTGSSQTSPSPEAASPPNLQSSQTTSSQHSAESPRRPKESLGKPEPIKLTERLPGDAAAEDDVIPDTQARDGKEICKTPSMSEEMGSPSQEEEAESVLDDSQSSVSSSSRSRRPRVPPPLPGEDLSQRDAKLSQLKRKRSQEESQSEPEQQRRNTRSQQAAEEMSRRIRTRSKGDGGLSSPKDSQEKQRKRIKLFNNSEDLERRRKRSSGPESSQTDDDSQTPKRRGRPKKAVNAIREPSAAEATSFSDKEDSSSKESSSIADEPLEPNEDIKLNEDSQIRCPQSAGSPQESEPATQTEKDQDEPNKGSQVVASPPKKQSREHEPELEASPPSERKSSDDVSSRPTAAGSLDEPLSQEDSEVLTPSSDSQSQRRSRRIKASPETVESQDQSKDSQKRQTRSSSQIQSEGRTTKRNSAPASGASADSSGSESSDAKESPATVKKKGYVHRIVLRNPQVMTLKELTGPDSDEFQEAESPSDTEESSDLEVLQGPQDAENKSTTELEEAAPLKEEDGTKDPSPVQAEQRDSRTSQETTSQGDAAEVESSGVLEEAEEPRKDDEDGAATLPPLNETTESAVSESSGAEMDSGKTPDDSDADCLQHPEEAGEETDLETSRVQDEEEQQHPDTSAEDGASSVAENNQDLKTQISESLEDPASSDKEEPGVNTHAAPGELCRTNLQDSPLKQKDLEAVVASDVGQSPGGGRTRGIWSPSASPSSSILKKSQKRQLEADSPSPLVKSRRVSFANPIQQQETADDIDRRSPAVRTSSPRRSKGGGNPPPKLVTTPTKGLLILSPRNLHSSGFKSSKKCLISEMSQEPRPVSKHCIYPALVGCSAPVEAVLPQISNMWSRGFGQLVRARNIKTVGDLSALTPAEVKTLPIRSPKMSNVKKALQTYEQQRKGRGGGDETERMTSEVEETSAPQTTDEDDMTTGETLATELPDEVVAEPQEARGLPEVREAPLLSELQALCCRASPAALGRCSLQELVDAHQLLGGLMSSVVRELKSRAEGAGPVP